MYDAPFASIAANFLQGSSVFQEDEVMHPSDFYYAVLSLQLFLTNTTKYMMLDADATSDDADSTLIKHAEQARSDVSSVVESLRKLDSKIRK